MVLFDGIYLMSDILERMNVYNFGLQGSITTTDHCFVQLDPYLRER